MELGILLFFAIVTMAFWMLIFLFGVAIPMWIGSALLQSLGKKLGLNKKKTE